MKRALDDYLKGGAPSAEPSMEPSDEDMDSMFGEEGMEEEEDPLMAALMGAGYEVDEGKLSQIRGILESSGEAEPLAGEETPEEEALEGHGGAFPAAAGKMKGKPNL